MLKFATTTTNLGCIDCIGKSKAIHIKTITSRISNARGPQYVLQASRNLQLLDEQEENTPAN